MNIQERIEALETEFNKKIKALKAEVQREDEFPQFGDDYWYVDSDTDVMDTAWYDGEYDQGRVSIDNVFKTKEQAELAVEKLKVEEELRKFGRPFKEREENWMVIWNGYDDNFVTESFSRLIHLGSIYFENHAKAQQAIESVGEKRIKKYLFGLED